MDFKNPLRLYPAVKLSVLFILLIGAIRAAELPKYFTLHHEFIFAGLSLIILSAAFYIYKKFLSFAFIMFIAGVALLICARYPSGNFDSTHLSRFNRLGRDVSLRGMVSRDPQVMQNKTRMVVDARFIQLTEHIGMPTQGQIFVTLKDEARTSISYGDEVTLYGTIYAPRNERNPGEFDYAAYLAMQDIYGTMHLNKSDQVALTGHSEANPVIKYFIHPIKHYVIELDQTTLSPLGASILTGLLVGERSDIPSEVMQYFSYSGTIHILSISGLHIVFITALLFGFFSFLRLRYEWRVYMTLLCLGIYMGVADMIPSVVRAGLMTGVVLIGTLLQRRQNIVNSLFVSLIIILFIQPLALFDIGLQLSFTAVLSIVLIYPRLENLCRKMGFFQSGEMSFAEKILALLLVSIAAQIGTIPFTAFYFYKIPLIALAANVLIVPLSSFVMGIGFITAIVGTFSMTAAQWFANVNDLSILLMVKLAEWSSKMPLAYMDFYRMDAWSMLWFYLLLGYFLLWKVTKIRKYGLIAFLSVVVFFVWKPVFFPENDLKIYFLDIGQGDASVIQTPGGKTIVIDAGDRTDRLDQGETVVAPFLRKIGVNRIDRLILTHPHDDHIGGADYLLKHFEVGEVIDPGQFYRSDVYLNILKRIREKNIPRRKVRAGDFLAIDDEVELYFMHPRDGFVSAMGRAPVSINNASVVFQLRYKNAKALFMGDTEWPGIEKVEDFAALLQSDILKAGHHGSWNGTTQSLIAGVQPKFAVISCGAFNKFKHPSPAVVHELAMSGSQVLRTDESGAIILRSNGNGFYRER
jgi:competence protein ComEC